MTPFGQLLRQYRVLCRDVQTGKPLSLEKFADLLHDETGLVYSGATIGNWERGETEIDKENRAVLIGFIKIFLKQGVINSLSQANQFLEAGNFRALTAEEIQKANPSWEYRFQKSGKTTHSKATTPTSDNKQTYTFMSPAMPPQGVFGRKKITMDIVERLLSQGTSSENNAIGLIGFGGVGKTTLAVSLSHNPAIRDLYPNGVFWAALGPQPQTRYLLERWGKELGLDLILERSERDCSQSLRNAFHDKSALLVIDDVWDVKNAQYFFVAGPGSNILFTTRESEPANLLTLKKNLFRVSLLEEKDALALLARLAPEVLSVDKKAAKELCARLGNLPLAITLAGRLLATESDVPGKMKRIISELIEHHEARLNLLQHEGRLGVDEDNPVSLQAILGMSVARLQKVHRERFAMLSVFGGEPLSWELTEAKYIWQCSQEEAEDTIHEFLLRGLVEPRPGAEYGMHALLADYAEELRVALKL